MKNKVIATTAAPAAIGPYVQGIQAGNTTYFSGQLGINPDTGKLVDGGVKAQAEQALKNIAALLEATQSSPEHIVKTTIFITDMTNFATVNEVYAAFFDSGFPARSCVAVSQLPLNALVEIEIIVVK